MEESEKIIAAVPFRLDQGGRIFEKGDAGFQQVIGGLETLGDMASNQKKSLGIDAIPSSAAHLLKMHSDMGERYLKERYQEENWRKAIVIYVLSSYRAYSVEIEQILKQDRNDILWELFGEEIADYTGVHDCIYMFRFAGKDVAVLDQKFFLLPIAEFPWEIKKNLGENCIDGLMDYEKDILWTFLKGLDDRVQDNYYIKNFLESLEKYHVKAVENLICSPLDMSNMLQIAFGVNNAAWDYFRQIPHLPINLPEVFQSNLALALTERGDEGYFGFGKTLTFEFAAEIAGDPYHFSGFLPLTEKMADFLEKRDEEIQLENVAADASRFAFEKKIVIALTFMVCGQEIVLKKSYSKEQIQFMDSVPLLTVFPYVDLPKEKWKCYYQVLKVNESNFIAGNNAVLEFISEFQIIPGQEIDMMDPDLQRTTKAENEKEREKWYYYEREALPLYIKLCRADFTANDRKRNEAKKENYIGCIDVGRPKISRSRFGRTFHWALDMGTRNTIAALRAEDEKSISVRLVKDKLYCPLLLAIGKMHRDFSRQCFSPDDKVEDCFPTMARIYSEGIESGSNICYIDGCALFSDAGLVSELIEKSTDWEKSAVYTDLKFGIWNKAHDKALRIFLHHMLWLGCLECVLNGADRIVLHVSYPRSEVWNRINDIWQEVIRAVQKNVVAKINPEIRYCSEAEANSRYLYQTLHGNRVTPNSIYGICDIGDGTSDFNLYLGSMNTKEGQQRRIQFSMRYAGGDILVDTVMQFGNKMEFGQLWNDLPDQEGETDRQRLIEKYQEMLSMDEDSTRESRRNIVLALIESVGLREGLPSSENPDLRDLAAILLFKYWNLFRVYGEMLEKFNPNPYFFKLFIYGGGRMALKDATGKPLSNFRDTEYGKDIIIYLGKQTGVDRERFVIDLREDVKKKQEVVTGLLTEYGQNTSENVPFSGRAVDEYYSEICSDTLPEKELSNERREQLLEGYQKYIQDIKEKEYFRLSRESEKGSIYHMLSIDASNKALGTMEGNNKTAFDSNMDILWQEVTQDKDNPRCLWEVLFYSKISNMLLNKNIP